MFIQEFPRKLIIVTYSFWFTWVLGHIILGKIFDQTLESNRLTQTIWSCRLSFQFESNMAVFDEKLVWPKRFIKNLTVWQCFDSNNMSLVVIAMEGIVICRVRINAYILLYECVHFS